MEGHCRHRSFVPRITVVSAAAVRAHGLRDLNSREHLRCLRDDPIHHDESAYPNASFNAGRASSLASSVKPPTRVRNRATKIHFGIIFASVVAVLVVAGLVTAFAVEPPLLGWIGFGMAAIIVAGLGVVATLSIPRLRVSPPEPAVDAREQRRLLVVADAQCSETALRDEIHARLEGVVAVHLVVPVRVSHLHFLANDESDETRDSEQSRLTSLGLLQRLDVEATGSVGTDKPLESMTDALGSFPATDVLLAIPPEK